MVIKNDLSPNKPHHFHSDYRAHHHLAGNPEKGFFLMFGNTKNSTKFRHAIEDVVNPQVFALRKEISEAKSFAGQYVDQRYAKLRDEFLQFNAEESKQLRAEFNKEHLKTLNNISEVVELLSARISELETAAITPVTSRKVRRPKRRVRARGKAK